jgi:hypothetical protein
MQPIAAAPTPAPASDLASDTAATSAARSEPDAEDSPFQTMLAAALQVNGARVTPPPTPPKGSPQDQGAAQSPGESESTPPDGATHGATASSQTPSRGQASPGAKAIGKTRGLATAPGLVKAGACAADEAAGDVAGNPAAGAAANAAQDPTTTGAPQAPKIGGAQMSLPAIAAPACATASAAEKPKPASDADPPESGTDAAPATSVASTPESNLSLFQAAYIAYAWTAPQRQPATAEKPAATDKSAIKSPAPGAMLAVSQSMAPREQNISATGIGPAPTSKPEEDHATATIGKHAAPAGEEQPAPSFGAGVKTIELVVQHDGRAARTAADGAAPDGTAPDGTAAAVPVHAPVSGLEAGAGAQVAAAPAAPVPIAASAGEVDASTEARQSTAAQEPPESLRADRITVQLPDDAGGARIQVAVRAGSVEARIVTPDAALTRHMETGLTELQGALTRQGFDEVKVSLSGARPVTDPAAAAWVPTAAGAASDTGDARHRGSSEGERRQLAEDRPNPYGDRQQQGRPNQRSRRERER